MRPAAVRLREALAEVAVQSPKITVLHNVDAAPHGPPAEIREALYMQADHPVLWAECIKRMAASGVTHVYECGPGKVLGPLSRRIVPELQGAALADRASMDEALQGAGT
jgi:[acyl-carrier-protein] S-malonyltransferase